MSHKRPLSRPLGVDGETDPAAAFGALRPRLLSVAYALLGSVEEAEDVVQEAWLRLERTQRCAEHAEIRDPAGWLVTTVSRLALDTLRSARLRREEYIGEWLPEPLVGPWSAAAAPAAGGEWADPADRVTLDESMSVAMLVVLESLSPAERTAFVLHDVFGLSFAEIGRAVGRTPAACRQSAARARRHVSARAPRFDVDAAEHRRIVDAFLAAVRGGDLDGLVRLLDPDVVLRSDGGGVVRSARRPIRGRRKVARFLLGVRDRFGAGRDLRPAAVNGRPGFVGVRRERIEQVAGVAVSGGRISAIDAVLNPEKLKRAGRNTTGGGGAAPGHGRAPSGHEERGAARTDEHRSEA
ncbi:sigma-70 family RNA polymerase sigma factor [Streptomonospora sp. PA3]|uniref:RNA polymerase sigma factor SigJ n=1 Tax=Streptomonospora sp. PA3 TaxID=2607326 RepID=UPI0012DE4220|nr:RNA polymerase sigma factor SigJ [Streptomonospora sp. PA3]MUL41165.1 sigma-70 family RNA polymerase sigma factor [Streptomonospora sp. PA3]